MDATNRRLVLTAMLAMIAGACGRTDAGTVVWACTDSQIGTLDLTNGQFTATGTTPQPIASLTTGSDGTLYAGVFSTGNLYTVAADGAMARFGSSTAPDLVYGLADAGSKGFYAATIGGGMFILDQFSANGNSISTVGIMGIDIKVFFPPGALAFGPDGNLYLSTSTLSGFDQLYRVNPATGAATAVGTGLGLAYQELLTLVAADGKLYGIDASIGNGIYTINTDTGLATYTGVNYSSGIEINAAASIVPEPSTLTLLFTPTVALVGLAYQRRRRRRSLART